MTTMGIALSLHAKGVSGLASRAAMVLTRFGTTPTQMERCLHEYVDTLHEFGVHPSFPVTACVLERHPGLFRELSGRGVEFAAHGLIHNDHAGLSYAEQRLGIGMALTLFHEAGVPCAGFRGPYLRYNQGTIDAARDNGLRYHSSQTVVFQALPPDLDLPHLAQDAYERALRLYSARDARSVAVRPRLIDGLVDLPIALPDDEILVDRLHLGPRVQASVWLMILRATYARGALFTLQLHPERIAYCREALETVLTEAQSYEPGIWIAQMREIAGWWERRAETRLRVEQAGDDRYRVRLRGDAAATLLVRGAAAPATTPWGQRRRRALAPDIELTAPVKPVVGVSARTAPAVRAFLADEGWPLEISDDRTGYGAYVDQPEAAFDEMDLLGAVEQAPGPLVRLGRWPNGARSALAITGDIDSITLQDFMLRLWETR